MVSELKGTSRFLNDEVLNGMFELPPDLQRVDAEINQLNNQAIVRYYDEEWGAWK
jgi:spermidine synthase